MPGVGADRIDDRGRRAPSFDRMSRLLLNASCRGWNIRLRIAAVSGPMSNISSKIQLFNAAYKIAWDLALEHKAAAYGLAPSSTMQCALK
jgi:hypothetical protein